MVRLGWFGGVTTNGQHKREVYLYNVYKIVLFRPDLINPKSLIITHAAPPNQPTRTNHNTTMSEPASKRRKTDGEVKEVVPIHKRMLRYVMKPSMPVWIGGNQGICARYHYDARRNVFLVAAPPSRSLVRGLNGFAGLLQVGEWPVTMNPVQRWLDSGFITENDLESLANDMTEQYQLSRLIGEAYKLPFDLTVLLSQYMFGF